MNDEEIKAEKKRRFWEDATPPTEDEQRRFRHGFSGNDIAPRSKPDAAYWFGMKSVLPADAAKVLFGIDPINGNSALAEITPDESESEDLKLLICAFEDLERAEPKSRTLHQWYDHAVERRLKFPAWIDEFVPDELNETVTETEKVDGAGTVSNKDVGDGETAEKEQMVKMVSVRNHCADFLALPDLLAREVSIEFVAGDSGGVILNVSARKVKHRIALAELGLIDRRKGVMNTQGGLLLGLAQGRRIKTSSQKTAKQFERLRNALKSSLGIKDNPITNQDGVGYLPTVQLADKRGTADMRAKREAERRTVSLDELQESGIQFEGNVRAECDNESEGDAADEWLRKSAG
jgi:hypothetical protein